MVEQGKSGQRHEEKCPGIGISCMYRWCRELKGHINVLATEGAKRLGIAPLSGSVQTIWHALKAQVGAEGFLIRLQEDLVRDYPPLGIFRTLIPMSIF